MHIFERGRKIPVQTSKTAHKINIPKLKITDEMENVCFSGNSLFPPRVSVTRRVISMSEMSESHARSMSFLPSSRKALPGFMQVLL